MSREFEQDRQSVGRYVIALRYDRVLLSTHQSSELLTPQEALTLFEWLQRHQEALYLAVSNHRTQAKGG